MKYKDYNDSELISYIKEQNEEANEIMYNKYKPLVINISKKFVGKISGYDVKDLINEGMLGVFNAILSYKEDLNVPFYSYVKLCVEKSLMSLFKKNTAPKSRVLNESISYDNTDDSYNFENIIGDNSKALYNMIDIENTIEFKKYMKSILTPLEYKVFIYKFEGYKVEDIASVLKKDIKNINNTIYRIRKKMKDIVKN